MLSLPALTTITSRPSSETTIEWPDPKSGSGAFAAGWERACGRQLAPAVTLKREQSVAINGVGHRVDSAALFIGKRGASDREHTREYGGCSDTGQGQAAIETEGGRGLIHGMVLPFFESTPVATVLA